MKNSAAVLAVFILSGCVSADQLRRKSPIIDVSSQKTSRAVAACITEKWQKSGSFGMPMDVNNNILEDGYSIFVMNSHVVQLLADVRDVPSGSNTKYYEPGLVAATGKFRNAIKDCQ